MTHANNALQSALRKAKHHQGKEYVAYVTPVEIQALLADGAKTSGYPSQERVAAVVSSGQCRPCWFYFEPGQTKPKDKPQPDRHHRPRQKL